MGSLPGGARVGTAQKQKGAREGALEAELRLAQNELVRLRFVPMPAFVSTTTERQQVEAHQGVGPSRAVPSSRSDRDSLRLQNESIASRLKPAEQLAQESQALLAHVQVRFRPQDRVQRSWPRPYRCGASMRAGVCVGQAETNELRTQLNDLRTNGLGDRPVRTLDRTWVVRSTSDAHACTAV